jgi:glyoxylase-like metal-dependent hydrolase (beta-lactamase superfamily II)/rhodanese-related sulfurtransferase
MLFRQVLHPDLGCASYVIADTVARVGAVIDPKWEIEEYLELAQERGFRISDVIETHNHADHLSGRARLVEATGARCWVHPLADAGYAHTPLADGDEIRIGQVMLRALHTPGHRPEHTAILVVDGARSAEPCAVLTGDSLFVNDVARPDLAVEKREGARGLYASMLRLSELDDGVEVYPGHTGGSLCGSARMSDKTSSTIGFERRNNGLMQMDDEERFVAALINGLAPQPPNFKLIAEANRGGDPTAVERPVALAAERFQQRIEAGALVVDGRSPEDYDAGHIPGSVGVTLSVNGFGTKVAWLADGDRELLLVGGEEHDAVRMAVLLGSVGVHGAHGMLAGGFEAWRAAGLPLERFAAVDVPGLALLREQRPDLQILDVRDDYEWDQLRISGSAHVVYHDVGRVIPPLDPALPVAVICSTGRRSAMAVGLVRRAGFAEVIHVTPGGVSTWAGLGHPVDEPHPAVPA